MFRRKLNIVIQIGDLIVVNPSMNGSAHTYIPVPRKIARPLSVMLIRNLTLPANHPLITTNLSSVTYHLNPHVYSAKYTCADTSSNTNSKLRMNCKQLSDFSHLR